MGGAISLRRFPIPRPNAIQDPQAPSAGEEGAADNSSPKEGPAALVSPAIEDPSSPVASRPALLSIKSSNSISLRTRNLEQLEESAESMVEALSENNQLVRFFYFFLKRDLYLIDFKEPCQCKDHHEFGLGKSYVQRAEDERHGQDISDQQFIPIFGERGQGQCR